LLGREVGAVEQAVRALHDGVLDRVVGLLLGGDLQDDWVDFLAPGDLLLEVFLADLLGDQDDGDGGVVQEAVEGGFDLPLVDLCVGRALLSSTIR
jgi:hypothetical protein